MRNEQRVLVTDTTMRDAHQSLIATRMRTRDIVAAAEAYAKGLPQLLSLECWGGATFDVAMRFLSEDPWERLALVRERAPNLLTQMLLRGANGVGYTNYPDNVVKYFVRRAAAGHRSVPHLRLPQLGREHARLDRRRLRDRQARRGRDLLHRRHSRSRPRQILARTIMSASPRSWSGPGCHILAIKDMAGLLLPAAARVLVKALREEVGLPLHLHTHDTSGISAATVLAAIDAGVDAVDAAMDSMSGMTSQPCLGSIVAALRHSPRDPGLDAETIRQTELLLGGGARCNTPPSRAISRPAPRRSICTRCRAASSPTCASRRAALGLETRWHEVAKAYRAANDLFGDIVKVTPSSKVVGDMALMMVSQNLTPRPTCSIPTREIAFPDLGRRNAARRSRPAAGRLAARRCRRRR